MKLQLVIGNKNYSSWSMRPWVLLRQAGIPFDEVQLKFQEKDGGLTVAGIDAFSPTRKVPALMVDGDPVWDSLAICETVAELYPDKQLWPADAAARRMARSACAEMHSSFQALRRSMPMNIRNKYPGKGMNADSKKDIDRIVALWKACRDRYGQMSGSSGQLLFGRFSVADAFYAPVVMRFRAYVVKLPQEAMDYCAAVEALPAVRDWMDGARREKEFVAEDEPYATK